MSESGAMAWEGKRMNPRDEEKFLDDKLTDLGLLEPGMSLEEKRQLASVVLESTRMAEEQMSQRAEEERWEVMLMSQENESMSDSKGPETITIPDSPESESSVKNCFKYREKRGEQPSSSRHFSREEGGNGEAQSDRGRRGRTNREESRRKRDNRTRKETFGRDSEFSTYRETNSTTEKRNQEKKDGEKSEENRDENMVEKQIDSKMGEVHKRKVDSSDTSKTNTESKNVPENIKTETFYGSSHLISATHPNPFDSEIYGSTSKYRMKKVPQVNLHRLAEEVFQNKVVKLSEDFIENVGATCQDKLNSKDTLKKSADRDVLIEKEESKTKRKQRKVTIVNDPHVEEMVQRWTSMKEDETSNSSSRSMIRTREAKKRGDTSRTILCATESVPSNPITDKKHTEVSLEVNCEKRKRREPTIYHSSSTNEVKTVEVEENVDGEKHIQESGNCKAKEKKRKLEKGVLQRQWTDVVSSRNSDSSEVEDIDQMEDSSVAVVKAGPNKRWRRVRRKYKSTFGSGSEVDEWISSEEEKKSVKVVPLTKEQIVAKFDDYLMRLKIALKKQNSNIKREDGRRISCQSHKPNSKFKVPPGFQEPDSDDDCNLWKLCFFDKSSSKGKSNRGKAEEIISAPSELVSTISKSRQSPRSSSESPASIDEAHEIPSPVRLSPIITFPSLSILPTEEVRSNSKSPSLKEIDLFDKVICPSSGVSKSTQTLWNDDMNSNHSSTSSVTTSVTHVRESKGISQNSEPLWDLFHVDSELEEISEAGNNGGKSNVINNMAAETMSGETIRRPKTNVHKNSPHHVSMKSNKEESTVSESKIIVGGDGENSRHNFDASLSESSVSPVLKRKLSRENSRIVRSDPGTSTLKRIGEDSKKKDSPEPEGHLQTIEERAEQLPETMPCPICNQVYLMTEIEAHASGCNPEEDSSEGETSAEPSSARSVFRGSTMEADTAAAGGEERSANDRRRRSLTILDIIDEVHKKKITHDVDEEQWKQVKAKRGGRRGRRKKN